MIELLHDLILKNQLYERCFYACNLMLELLQLIETNFCYRDYFLPHSADNIIVLSNSLLVFCSYVLFTL